MDPLQFSRRSARAAFCAGFAVLAFTCVPSRAADEPELPEIVAALIAEIDAGAPAERSDAEWQQTFEAAIHALRPGMGAEAIPDRQAPQQALERICRFFSAPGSDAQRAALARAAAKFAAEEGPLEARVWLLRQLERVGRAECVPQLAVLLAGSDARLAECARRALQHNSSEEAAAALREALLAARDEPWQIALVNALGARRDAESVELVQRVELTPSATPSLRGACHAALADIATPEALDALAAMWREGSNPGRTESAAASLLRAAERFAVQGERSVASIHFNNLFNSGSSVAVRRGALRGLVEVGGRKNLDTALAVALERSDPAFSQDALRFLEARPADYVTRALVAEVKSAATPLRARLLDSLAARWAVDARPVALDALGDADEAVRVAAARALSAFGNASDAAALAAAAAAATGDAERSALRAALDEMRGAGTDAAIVAQINDGPAGVRVESARAAAVRRSPEATTALFKATEADDDAVRVAAIESLGKLAEPDALRSVVHVMMGARSDASRAAAEDAVVAVASRVASEAQRADEVLAGLRVADPAVEPSFMRVLGRIGGTAALEALRDGTTSEHAATLDAAVRALAAWEKPEALGDLRRIAEHAADEAHQVLALRGFIRLVRAARDRSADDTLADLDWARGAAKRGEERKLVIAALGEVGAHGSLERLEPLLADATLKNEAAAAVVTVASALAGEDPGAARAALDAAQAAAPPQAVLDRVAAARKRIEDHAGYIGAWEIAGPYFEEGLDAAKLVDHAFAPETDEAEFRPLVFRGDENPWEVDLARAIGGSNRCVYLRARVHAPEARSVKLKIGSDDGVKVWWNGAEVHSVSRIRGLTCGEDTLDVELGAGENTVMLKVAQGAGGWAACCGVFDTDGKPIEGLMFSRTGFVAGADGAATP